MKRFLKTVIVICLVLLAGVGIVSGVYLKQQWDRTTYFANTTINGFDASEKTPKELLTQMVEAYTAPMIQINERGAESITASLEDLGYELDQATLLKMLEEAFSQQKSSIPVLITSLLQGNGFQIKIPFSYDETTFLSKVNVAALKEERIVSVDAEMIYDEPNKNYYIQPEIVGNELSDADMQAVVKEQVDQLVAAREPQQDLIIELPDSIYIKPQVTHDDIELNNLCNIYNHYVKAQITYLFGEEKIVLDWNTIKDWLIIENGNGELDHEAMYIYGMNLAKKYNTAYYSREFHTSVGTTVTFPGSHNEYGYLVDEDGEFNQMLLDIQSNTAVEREPVYYHSGYKRNGVDDLAGTYVEVNLTAQRIWFYKNGELIVESPIVSGDVSEETETQTGVFPLAYKESPSVLTGGNAEDGWETDVTYWMPFFDGQGLHDATWRSNFGGSIYQNNGSHGCVNLPFDTAKRIYENIDAGVAIILYK